MNDQAMFEEDELGRVPESFPPIEGFLAAKSGGFTLFGKPLAKYSASRVVAANAMGMLYPAIGEEGAAQWARCGTYPGIIKDIICLLWLCTLKDPSQQNRDDLTAKRFTPQGALMNPRGAWDAALAWAEAEGITDMQAGKYSEALQVFVAIVTGVEAAKFQIVVNGEAPEDEPGKAEPAPASGPSTSPKCGRSLDMAPSKSGIEWHTPRDSNIASSGGNEESSTPKNSKPFSVVSPEATPPPEPSRSSEWTLPPEGLSSEP